MSVTHTEKNLQLIDRLLKEQGITEYRFCVENDCYVCDRLGRVFSICKRQYSKSGNLVEFYRVQELKGSVDKDGYTTYRITIDGIKKHVKGHRLILNAWDTPHVDLCVNHKDGNKQNNALENLEWCTVAENNAHAIETGLFNPRKPHKFLKIPMHDWMTIYILNKHCGYSYCELGRMNHCGHDAIKRVVSRVESIMPSEVTNG